MITDRINVKCEGQTVTRIVDKNGALLAGLTAEVENADQYQKPTGTREIFENGRFDVSGYADVLVDVQGGGSSVPFADVTYLSDGARRAKCMYTRDGVTNSGGYLEMAVPSSGTHIYLLVKTRSASTDSGTTGSSGNGMILASVDCDEATVHGSTTKSIRFFGTAAIAVDTYSTVSDGLLVIKGTTNNIFAFNDDDDHVAEYEVYEFTGVYTP